jgi:hypothetical protein
MRTRLARFPQIVRVFSSLAWFAMWALVAHAAPPPNPKPALVAHFNVRDAKTQEPVTGLRIVSAPRYENEHAPVTWQSQYLKRFASSPADYTMKKGFAKTVLRVDADGYLPYVTRTIKPGESEVSFDVLLEPDAGMAGKVLQPDGAPAAGASLAVCTWTNEVYVAGGKLRLGHHGEELSQIYETAADGTFRVPREIDPFLLVLAHDSGYAEATAGDFSAASTITLKPWGRVEGACVIDGKPVSDVQIAVGSGRGDLEVVLHRRCETTTDAAGEFVLERVPPVSVYVNPRFKFGDTTFGGFWFSGNTQIAPGQTTHITLPRPGRPILGRIVLPPESGLELSNLAFDVSIALRPPSNSFMVQQSAQGEQAHRAFMRSDPGKAFQRDKIAVNADGAFRIDGLPETIYILRIRAYAKTDPPGTDRKSLGSYISRVTLPPRDEDDAPLDLGPLLLRQ